MKRFCLFFFFFIALSQKSTSERTHGETAHEVFQRVCSEANWAVGNFLTGDATRGLSVHRESLSYQAEMTQFHSIKWFDKMTRLRLPRSLSRYRSNKHNDQRTVNVDWISPDIIGWKSLVDLEGGRIARIWVLTHPSWKSSSLSCFSAKFQCHSSSRQPLRGKRR